MLTLLLISIWTRHLFLFFFFLPFFLTCARMGICSNKRGCFFFLHRNGLFGLHDIASCLPLPYHFNSLFPLCYFYLFFFESHHTQSFIYTFLFLFLCFGVPLLSAFSLSFFLTFFLLRFFQYYMDVADYDNLIRAVKRHGCVHWFSLLCSFWSFYVSCFFVFVFLLVVMLF